jgi:Xaa-Pro aminopeptidase
MIKPGVTGSALIEAVLETIRGEGFGDFLLVVPHSIGLGHTDHPMPIGLDTPESKGELVFRENMTINVDMPYHELGWGAMHLEDTIVVTADGCDALTSQNTELFVAA